MVAMTNALRIQKVVQGGPSAVCPTNGGYAYGQRCTVCGGDARAAEVTVVFGDVNLDEHDLYKV
jgi:hypothetical protein